MNQNEKQKYQQFISQIKVVEMAITDAEADIKEAKQRLKEAEQLLKETINHYLAE